MLLLWLAMAAYAITFSVLTIERYAAFEARALDMGNLNQAIWNTAYGNPFHLTNQPGTVNRLSLHVEPILLPIAALYRLYPQPSLLLVLQAIIVALGALPLFALARHKLGNAWVALAFGIIFLLNPTIQAANWLEFHPLTLAPTFLLAAFYALVTGRDRAFGVWALLAASCKEEMTLLVFMLGLYALVWLRRPRLGLITMTLALTWAFLAVFVIQNLFAAGNIHWGRYGYLGDSPGAMVWGLLTQPGLVWAQLVKANAGAYLWQLLWPTGFIALLAPEVLLLALPSLAVNLLADFPPMHQVNTLIYAAPILPFVLAASVMGLARLRDGLIRLSPQRRPRRAQAFVPLAAGLLLLAGLYNQQLYGYLPGSGNYLDLRVTDHHRRAANIIAQIAPDAAVSAQDRLNPHVSGRETVYIFPRLEDEQAPDADTVFIDVTGPAWPQHPSDLRASVDDLLASGWGIAAADDGYLLLRQGITNGTFPPAFYSAWQRPDAQPAPDFGVTFGEQLQLLDSRVTTDRYGELMVELTWLPLAELTEDYRFYIGYLDAGGETLYGNDFYQPISVLWYPTDLWQPGVPVQVQSLPWTLAEDRFTLVVGVYTGGNWLEGTQLPITTDDAALPILEGDTLRVGGYQRTENGWELLPIQSAPPATVLDTQFGDAIRLDGATGPSLASAGDALTFTLYWQTVAPVATDYTTFAQLVNAQGNKVAQLDWQPHDNAGLLPTSAWVVARPVVDTQTLALPPDLPPGEYWLHIGMYQWQDGSRLPVAGDLAQPGDVAVLGPVQIE